MVSDGCSGVAGYLRIATSLCSIVSGVVSGVLGQFPMVSGESWLATRCGREFSVRHFVEHLVCSTPGTVAGMDLGFAGFRVWAPDLGSGFGLGSESFSFYFYFNQIN